MFSNISTLVEVDWGRTFWTRAKIYSHLNTRCHYTPKPQTLLSRLLLILRLCKVQNMMC